jgi:hypothetical protein
MEVEGGFRVGDHWGDKVLEVIAVRYTADSPQEPNSDHICLLAAVLDYAIAMVVQPGLEGLTILKVVKG